MTLASVRNLKNILPLIFAVANRGSYMNPLNIAYKNNDRGYSVVRIGSPALILFY